MSNLAWSDWSKVFDVFGVVLFAYAIHAAIPTAYRAFGGRRYHKLIITGLGLSSVIYVLWSAARMSIVSSSKYYMPFIGALTGEAVPRTRRAVGSVAVAELDKLPEAYVLGYVFGYLTTLTTFIVAAHALNQVNLQGLKKYLQEST